MSSSKEGIPFDSINSDEKKMINKMNEIYWKKNYKINK